MAYLLIVDDDADFAGAVSAVLRNHGYKTAIEYDCRQTISRIREQRPDAIILDVMFPESDTAGFEVARDIRHTFGDLPVLLLTAVNQTFPLGSGDRDLDPAWLPAVDFLEKPVDFKMLCERIAIIVGGAPQEK
jgi:two-component system, OmpR family, alkaline phosphatase synthesis response regulator PhoP